MSTYFELHPPRLRQWQAVRDPKGVARFHEATGTIVIHTFEANVSLGTRRAADFLVNRTDRQASYHAVCGPASGRDVIQMAPWGAAAWHETHSNRWSIGISMVTQAAAWGRITPTQRENLVTSAAYAAYLAASWLKTHRGITVPAKRITRAQAMNGRPGFIGHGEMDPGRRSDPGAGFPWQQFLSTYAALMGDTKGSAPAPAPDENEDDMPKLDEKIQLNSAAGGVLGRDGISYGGAVQYAAAGGWEAMKRLPRIEATLKAQAAALEALAKSQGVDPRAVERTITAAVDKALAGIEITLTTEG